MCVHALTELYLIVDFCKTTARYVCLSLSGGWLPRKEKNTLSRHDKNIQLSAFKNATQADRFQQIFVQKKLFTKSTPWQRGKVNTNNVMDWSKKRAFQYTDSFTEFFSQSRVIKNLQQQQQGMCALIFYALMVVVLTISVPPTICHRVESYILLVHALKKWKWRDELCD